MSAGLGSFAAKLNCKLFADDSKELSMLGYKGLDICSDIIEESISAAVFLWDAG
ncbi:MAG: hypothetical protein RLZZ252_972 [Bacteroidota bacterium]